MFDRDSRETTQYQPMAAETPESGEMKKAGT